MIVFSRRHFSRRHLAHCCAALLLGLLTGADAAGSYTVKPGDNLTVIARRTGLTLGQLRAANRSAAHLDNLRAGSVLRVPDAHKPATAHKVQPGETLGGVAARYRLSLGQLLRANPKLSASKPVQAGKKLYIPARRIASSLAKVRTQASVRPASSQPRPLVRHAAQSSAAWRWPVQGWISSSFGERSFDGDTEMHYGIDIVVPEGTAVRASRSGRVTEARADFARGWGWTITLDHGDGWTTRYAHLSRLAARSGDQVNAGQVIGRSGNSGRSTGPHLHYGTYFGGVPKNPLALLD